MFALLSRRAKRGANQIKGSRAASRNSVPVGGAQPSASLSVRDAGSVLPILARKINKWVEWLVGILINLICAHRG
jgi:hypothetical protein